MTWSSVSGHRARQAAVRRRICQCAAPLRRPGQSGGLPGPAYSRATPSLGMSLANGGHLTHGTPVNFVGQATTTSSPTASTPTTGRIDYDEVRAAGQGASPQADRRRCVGLSPRHRLQDLRARSPTSYGALLMVDMAHIAGLVAGGAASEPRSLCRRRDHHHPQDPARPPRRSDPGQGGAGPRSSTPPSSPAPRAAP